MILRLHENERIEILLKYGDRVRVHQGVADLFNTFRPGRPLFLHCLQHIFQTHSVWTNRVLQAFWKTVCSRRN